MVITRFVFEWYAGINCIILRSQIPVLPLTRRGKTKFATIKWYNLCLNHFGLTLFGSFGYNICKRCQQNCCLNYTQFGPLSKLLAFLMRKKFWNARRVHRFILCQNYIMSPLFEQVSSFIWDRRSVAVTRDRMICHVLKCIEKIYTNSKLCYIWNT